MKRLFITIWLALISPFAVYAEPMLLLASASQDRFSLDQAVEVVRKQIGGRVLAAQTVTENGQRYHRIKVVSERGEVRVIYVNANTGHIE